MGLLPSSNPPPAPPLRPGCSNLVYMGMGEPMHNLPAVLPSIETLCQPMGMHFSYNKACVQGQGGAGRRSAGGWSGWPMRRCVLPQPID